MGKEGHGQENVKKSKGRTRKLLEKKKQALEAQAFTGKKIDTLFGHQPPQVTRPLSPVPELACSKHSASGMTGPQVTPRPKVITVRGPPVIAVSPRLYTSTGDFIWIKTCKYT